MFVVFVPICTFSQSFELIGIAPNHSTTSTLVVIAEQKHENLVLQLHEKHEQVGIIKINSLDNIDDLKRDLNTVFNNQNLHINPKRVHLLIIGNTDFFDKCNQFKTDFFVTKTYVYTTTISESFNENHQDFEILDFSTINWNNLIAKVIDKQLWEVELKAIRQGNTSFINIDDKVERGFGLQTGFHFPIVNTDNYTPNSIFNYGLTHYKQIKKDWFINTTLSVGIQIPNPQKVLRGAARSQIDITALQNGDPIDIELNTTLEGHIYGIGTFGGFYKWSNQKLQPMIGAGISYTLLMPFQTTIDTVITIDPNTLQQGNVNGSFAQNRRPSELRDNILSSTGIYTTVGFQYELHPNVVFNLQGQYNFNFTDKLYQNIGLNAGLSLRFRGKRRQIYEYIRIL